MKNISRFASLVLLLVVSIATTQAQNTLLFKVSGNGLAKPSYVFGTIHLVCSQTYKVPEPVKAVITSADVLYTEVEIANMQQAAMKGIKYMMAKPDSILDKLFSAEEYKKVGAFLNDTLGMPVEQLKMLKPNAIATLGLAKLAPCAPFTSVEEALVAAIPKKTNKGLESIEYQLELLMSSPMKKQALALLETVNEWNKGKAELKKLIAAYEAGNLDLLHKLMTETESSDFISQADLIDTRNKNWVAQMPTIMKTQSVVFAVGAGHLAGKQGVLALLKAKGYTITPIALR